MADFGVCSPIFVNRSGSYGTFPEQCGFARLPSSRRARCIPQVLHFWEIFFLTLTPFPPVLPTFPGLSPSQDICQHEGSFRVFGVSPLRSPSTPFAVFRYFFPVFFLVFEPSRFFYCLRDFHPPDHPLNDLFGFFEWGSNSPSVCPPSFR